VRRHPRTRKPAAAAQNPPIIQRVLFIVLSPICVLIPIFGKTMRRAKVNVDERGGAPSGGSDFVDVRENGYTLDMDSVRFGRALGIGARLAAKTLVTAVDAATAPNPSAAAKVAGAEAAAASGDRTKAESSGARLGEKAARTTAQVVQTGQGLKRGGRRFGEAVWGPFVKLSGQLWLEMTGVFFGIFAAFAASSAWKMRGELRETAMNHDAHMHLLLTAAMAVVFGYFCVSSFVKANRRGKRR
jgi:hypothetical protein